MAHPADVAGMRVRWRAFGKQVAYWSILLVSPFACGRLGYDPLVVDDVGDALDALAGQDTQGEAVTGDVNFDSPPQDASIDLPSDVDAQTDIDATLVDVGQTECDSANEGGLVAQWQANGNLDNDVMCPALKLEVAGIVPYLQGAAGQAWSFRSEHTSDDGDPDFLKLATSSSLSLRSFTLDAWVRQTGMNNFAGSNRVIVGTNFSKAFLQPQAMTYLHENGWTFMYVRTGTGAVRGTDWETCAFRNLTQGIWVRVTGTYDGQWLRCYVNGTFLSRTALPFIAPFPLTDFVLGRSYPGDIDGVRVFERALSDPEVAEPWP